MFPIKEMFSLYISEVPVDGLDYHDLVPVGSDQRGRAGALNEEPFVDGLVEEGRKSVLWHHMHQCRRHQNTSLGHSPAQPVGVCKGQLWWELGCHCCITQATHLCSMQFIFIVFLLPNIMVCNMAVDVHPYCVLVNTIQQISMINQPSPCCS